MNFKGKNVLITGASGFVGSNLVRHFLKSGSQVHVVVKNESNPWRLKDLKGKINIHALSINDTKKLRQLLLKLNPNYIFNLAVYGAYSWQENTSKMINTNIEGTLSILNACADLNYECFVNTGSSSEYGFKKKPMNEEMLLDPNSFYAFSKASATLLCSVFARKYKKPIVTLRLFSVYGPYEDKNRLIPTAIKAAITGKKLSITSSRATHDFVFIDDVIDAFISATKVVKAGHQIFNIGAGKQYTNLEVAKKIRKISERGLKINIGTYKDREWDTNFWVSDIAKSRRILKWTAKHSLSEGLNQTYNWFKENLHLYK